MEKIANDKTAIKWLGLAHLVGDMYSGFLNPLMPFIASKLGFTMALATLLMAITQICSNLLQPLFGYFADNNLKRFFIFWGILLASIFIPLAPCATDVKILIIFMILGCLGGSFFHPQAMGFVNIFSENNCANNMGVFVSLGSLGFAIGPLVAAVIAQFYGLEKMLYTSILGIILASTMFLYVPKLSVISTKPSQKSFIYSFKKILSNGQMRLLMLIAMMKSLVTNSSCVLLPFLWKSMGHTPLYIGFAIFLFVFMGAIGSFLSPKVERRFGSKSVIYFSMWATFPIMLIFSFIYKTMPIISLVMFSLMGFVTMLAQPVVLVLAQTKLPEFKSIVAGFVNGFCWGIIALFMSILGMVAQKYGIMNVIIVLTLCPLIISYYVKYLKEE